MEVLLMPKGEQGTKKAPKGTCLWTQRNLDTALSPMSQLGYFTQVLYHSHALSSMQLWQSKSLRMGRLYYSFAITRTRSGSVGSIAIMARRRQAGPLGTFLPLSHASTAFVETPRNSASVLCVRLAVLRISFTSSPESSFTGSILIVRTCPSCSSQFPAQEQIRFLLLL